MDFLKKHWPWLVSAIAGAVTFIDPSVQYFAGQHAQYTTLILTIWTVALHWAKSPRS
jgi:hypothetical protein